MPTINKPKKKQKNLSVNEQVRRSIYDTVKWRNLRKAKLIQQPLCEKCLEAGIITEGCDIHHIVSFVDAPTILRRNEIAYDINNLMTLCKKCHQKIHN